MACQTFENEDTSDRRVGLAGITRFEAGSTYRVAQFNPSISGRLNNLAVDKVLGGSDLCLGGRGNLLQDGQICGESPNIGSQRDSVCEFKVRMLEVMK